jgi:hypothetical protein
MSGIVKEVFNDPKGENLLIVEVGNEQYTLALDGVISVKD